MPRRNSFDTEKSNQDQPRDRAWSERASQAPTIPTIHDSRSPSPLQNGTNNQGQSNGNFATGEWKNEMAQNGNMNKHVTVEEQARKLFDIFQSLPDNAKDRILQVRNSSFFFRTKESSIVFACTLSYITTCRF